MIPTLLALLLAFLQEHNDHILIIDGYRMVRKYLKLNDIDSEENLIDSLLGFHAITGNDCVSSFQKWE